MMLIVIVGDDKYVLVGLIYLFVVVLVDYGVWLL